jgi:hypothetical protein
MTEKKWLACKNYKPMLEFLGDRASERKVRLFAVACARQVWHLMWSKRTRAAVEVAERFADGLASAQEMALASRKAEPLRVSPPGKRGQAAYQAAWAGHCVCWDDSGNCASWTAASAEQAVSWNAGEIPWGDGRTTAEGAQRAVLCNLLRDVIGDPFRGVTIEPAWLVPVVRQLAQAIYDEYRFQDLPILADALEEAGCTSAELLGHLHGPGLHVRGCWAVDLLLERS